MEWWYAYAVQRMATPPSNKVLATNGVVKQQVQTKHIKKKQWLPTQQLRGALQQSLGGKKGTSESLDSAQLNDFLW